MLVTLPFYGDPLFGQIADTVSMIIENNEICLTIGGDHSMTVGTVNGHAEAEPGIVIVWIDAHADLNTPLSSDSGNIHGMPLSFVVKECQRYMPNVPGFDWVKPRWALYKLKKFTVIIHDML